jgi:homoserine kinase
MNRSTPIRVRVPASSANIGPGFDALGLALGAYLNCSVMTSDRGLTIRVRGVDSETIATDPSNLIYKAFCRLAGEDREHNVLLEIDNDLPLGRGLGSSAAAIMAGLALGNEWAQTNKSRQEIIQLATEIEGHPDNVAAAGLGGLVLSCQSDDGFVTSVKAPMDPSIQVVLVVPDFKLSTEAARSVLPERYPRRDVVYNLQRVALLVEAFRSGKSELFAEAMRDRLHQPYRAKLIPGFEDALKLKEIPGLLGIALSGAGPSVLAFCKGHSAEIGEAIAGCFRKYAIAASARLLPVDDEGLKIETGK